MHEWIEVIQQLAERYPQYEELRLDAFAAREQAVLRGILEGLTNREIADRIGASESTVKAILQQLFEKTRVRTRSQLVRMLPGNACAFPDLANHIENGPGSSD